MIGIELEAIEHHAHFENGLAFPHVPGDRYTVTDGGGWTAQQTAAALIAQGLAKAIDPKPKPKAAK